MSDIQIHTAKKPNETTSDEMATAVYARFFLERAKPPACVTGAHEEERRWRINFEPKFTVTDGHAVSSGGEGGFGGKEHS